MQYIRVQPKEKKYSGDQCGTNVIAHIKIKKKNNLFWKTLLKSIN